MKRIYAKRALNLTIIVLALCVFVSATSERRFHADRALAMNRMEQVEGELLVAYKKTAPYSRRLSSISSKHCELMKEFSRRGYIHVKLPSGMTVRSAMVLYASDPDVEAVQPNFRYTAASVPDDPLFSSQWGLSNTGQMVEPPSYTLADGSAIANPGTVGFDMNVPPVWNEIRDCSAVTVAVLDTGVNYNHEDLSGNMWDGGSAYPHHGWDFTGAGSSDPIDRNGHGTMVAGIIGASGNNGKGGTGICWCASVMAVKVLDAAGIGTSASVVDGINFAAANGAKVIVLSLVTHEFDQAVYDAINSSKERGVLVVVAAGNDTSDIDDGSAAYPAGYDLDNIICATALDQKYSLARFSNYGSVSVDIAAPGVNIVNAWAGTSSVISETFSTGWNAGDTNHPGTSGWGSTWENDIEFPGVKHWSLVNPSYDDGYKNNIRDNVWRDYAPFCKTADGIVLSFGVDYSFYDAGDCLGVYVKNTACEPSAADSVKIDEISGGAGKKNVSYDLTSMVKGTDHFQLLYLLSTNESGNAGSGVMISDMSVSGMWLSPTAYSNFSGTSMAAANVAGLAAMLFAFNPDYTYTDVLNAIYTGGRSISSLKNITRTGCAADAEGALEYISAPEGVSAELSGE